MEEARQGVASAIDVTVENEGWVRNEENERAVRVNKEHYIA